MKKLELYLMVHFTALLLQDHRESISISSSDNDLRYTIAYWMKLLFERKGKEKRKRNRKKESTLYRNISDDV